MRGIAVAGAALGALLGVGIIGAAGRQGPGPMPKDNSACLVCHINFEKEELAATHLKKGVTCAGCHGVSKAHMNDEEAATEPDLLFGHAEVAPLCRKCHGDHRNKAAVEKFLAEWQSKRRPHKRLIRADSICTDCHGLHRLPPGRVR